MPIHEDSRVRVLDLESPFYEGKGRFVSMKYQDINEFIVHFILDCENHETRHTSMSYDLERLRRLIN